MNTKILLFAGMLLSLWACQPETSTSTSTAASSFINTNNEPFYSIHQYIDSVNAIAGLEERKTNYSRDDANYTITGYRQPDKTVLKLFGETNSLTSTERMAYVIKDELPVYIHGLYKTFNCGNAETVCVDEVEHYLQEGRIIGSQIRSKKMSNAEAEQPDLSNVPYGDYAAPRDSVWKAAMNRYINYENSL